MSVEAGLKAFKSGRFSEAIALLHPYCQECETSGTTGSTAYMQAKMGLIKSYQGSRQFEEARALCEALTAGSNPALAAWANKLLPVLNAPPPTPVSESPLSQTDGTAPAPVASSENPQLLEDGTKLLKKGQYAEAIPLLEEYLQGCANVLSRNYLQAQMGMIKAYQGSGQKEKAIALCKSLLNTENTALRSWIAQNIAKLVPPEELEPIPAAADDQPPSADGTPSPPNVASPATSRQARNPPSRSYDANPQKQATSRPHTPTGTSPTRTTPTRTAPTRTNPIRPTSSSSTSSKNRSLQPGSQTSSYSIAHSGTSFIGKIFFDLIVRILIRRGIGLVLFGILWLLRGCFWGSGSPVHTSIVGTVTPLHYAAGQGNITEVQRLLSTGANVNAPDPAGKTPLFWAVSGCTAQFQGNAYTQSCISPNANHVQAVKVLLTQGADGKIQDSDGETPLHWAAEYGNPLTAQPLLDKGVDINLADDYGATPLKLAQEQGNQPMVDFLKSKGAKE